MPGRTLTRISPQLAVTAKWLMVAGIAYTIAQSVVFFVGQTDADPAVVTDSPNSPALPPVNIQAVMDRHLFGQADALSDTSTVAPSVETRLPLELQAVFVATEDDAESKAIVAEKGQMGRLYRIGADLPGGVQLVEVQDNFVVLSRAGSRERLTFPHLTSNLAAPLDLSNPDTLYVQEDPASMSNPYESVIPEQPVEPAPEPAPETPPAQQIEDFQSRLESDPEGALDAAGVQAVATDSAQGYRVGNLAQSPQLRQTGLQPGDVIVSVNGKAVGNVDADRMELASVLAQGSARIEVQRGSRRFFVTTSLNQQ